MKSDWQTKKLDEVCDIGAGNSAPQKKEFFTNGTYPFFRTSDIGQIHIGSIKKSSDYLNEKGIKGLKLFGKGTILLPKSGASTFLNHRVMLGTDGYVSSHLATIKTDEKILDKSFLFYFLQEIKAQELIQDHKYPSLNLPIIGNIKISYPESLLEQHRIVKILDEVFKKTAKAKENAEKNLQNAKKLFESYLQSVFANPGDDWDKNKLGEVCGFVRGPFGGSLRKNIFRDDGYAVYEQQHAIHDQFSRIRYFIDEKKFREMQRFELKPGELIMSCSGTMGKVAIAPEGLKTGIINQALLKLSPHKGLLNLFLKYWMESRVFQDDLKVYTKGAAIKNVVSVKILKEIPVFLPKMNEQKSIIRKLDALSAETEKLEKVYKQKLVDLEELKKSVLKKAFSGEL